MRRTLPYVLSTTLQLSQYSICARIYNIPLKFRFCDILSSYGLNVLRAKISFTRVVTRCLRVLFHKLCTLSSLYVAVEHSLCLCKRMYSRQSMYKELSDRYD